jgi:molybdopterin-guanine dinucleotide biosynthesis protein A
MGRDKAFQSLRGKSFLQHALETARRVTSDVVIVGEKGKYAPYAPVIEDVFANRGPLGGIHSALKATQTELNLIIGVDMPFLQPRFLQYLCGRAQASKAVVTVPRAAGGWQPLCAVYRRAFADVAERALHAGKNRIDLAFPYVALLVIEESEIAQSGFSTDMFRNVNTPEDMKEASEQA